MVPRELEPQHSSPGDLVAHLHVREVQAAAVDAHANQASAQAFDRRDRILESWDEPKAAVGARLALGDARPLARRWWRVAAIGAGSRSRPRW